MTCRMPAPYEPGLEQVYLDVEGDLEDRVS